MKDLVWRLNAFRGQKAEAVRRGKQPIKKIGSRFNIGSTNPTGCRIKTALKPVRQRVLVKQTCYNYKLSERRMCKVLKVPRSSFYYKSIASDQAALVLKMKEIASIRVRYGNRRIHTLLQREGWQVNHRRVYRLYKRENLQMRNKTPKRVVSIKTRLLPISASYKNECWSMDFVADELFDDSRIRI